MKNLPYLIYKGGVDIAAIFIGFAGAFAAVVYTKRHRDFRREHPELCYDIPPPEEED